MRMMKLYLVLIFGILTIADAEEENYISGMLTTEYLLKSNFSELVTQGNGISEVTDNTSDVNSTETASLKGSNSCNITIGNSPASQISNSSSKAMNNPVNNGLVSEEMYKKVSGILSQFTFPVLVVSLLCVVASIAVYTSPPMRTPTNTYLVFLGFADLLYVLCVLVLESTRTMYGASALQKKLYLEMAIYGGNYFAVCCRRLAYCVTSLVTLERLIAVAFPLRSRHFRLLKSPKLLIPVTTTVLFSFHVFSVLKLEVVPVPGSNNTIYQMSGTVSAEVHGSKYETLSVTGKVLFVFLPLFGCLLLNLITALYLRRRASFRKSLKNCLDSRIFLNERQTTLTIIVSTVINVLLNLPVSVSSVVSNSVDEYGLGKRQHYLFLLMNVVGYVCENMGCVSNFITYLILSRNFRKVFYTFICCWRHQLRPRSMGSYRTRSVSISCRIPVLDASGHSKTEDELDDDDKLVTVSETVN